jgi:hypothetical protein
MFSLKDIAGYLGGFSMPLRHQMLNASARLAWVPTDTLRPKRRGSTTADAARDALGSDVAVA